MTEPSKPGIFLKDIGGLPPLREEYVKANAPALPVLRNGKPVGAPDLTTTIPPFGSNAISSRPEFAPVDDVDLASRVLYNDPRDLWYLSLPAKLTPQQVLMILRAALGGDLWQQWQLQKLMSDSWVMFRKCAHELRSSVASVKFHVRAYHEQGKEPTDSAKRKAELVARGFDSWRPNPFNDEKGMYGLKYHLLDAVLSGITLCEVQWQEVNGEIVPRAATWVHPRQFTFSNAGHIAVWNMNMKAMVSPSPNKFMVYQYLSDSGSSLGAGLMRPLAWYWSAVIFNREWMLKFGQKHGGGFMKAFYPDGATEAEIKKLEDFLEKARNRGWVLLRKDQEDVEYVQPTNLSMENPHKTIINDSDEAAQMLLLGQTATTKGTPGKLGNEDTGETVRRERKEELAEALADGPLKQLAIALLDVNFDGDTSECPIIEPDFAEKLSPQEEAERDKIFLDGGVPMVANEFYARHNLTQPNDDDIVIISGKLGKMAGKEDPIHAKGAGAQPTDEKGMLLPPEPDDTGALPGKVEAVSVDELEAKYLLSHATDEQIARLSGAVNRALKAPHRNGEVKAVERELLEMANRK